MFTVGALKSITQAQRADTPLTDTRTTGESVPSSSALSALQSTVVHRSRLLRRYCEAQLAEIGLCENCIWLPLGLVSVGSTMAGWLACMCYARCAVKVRLFGRLLAACSLTAQPAYSYNMVVSTAATMECLSPTNYQFDINGISVEM